LLERRALGDEPSRALRGGRWQKKGKHDVPMGGEGWRKQALKPHSRLGGTIRAEWKTIKADKLR